MIVRSRNRGFTFIELLIVMAMLGLLSALAVPRIRTFKERAYLATMLSDLGNLRIAEEAYFADRLQYTTDPTALDARVTSEVQVVVTSTDLIGGYTAIATHALLPGQQCTTSVGRDAVGVASGAIRCGPRSSGSGTLAAPGS
jgi:prepilin-type N-terminal cleavage/methylation domain-containing protein